MLFTYRIQIRDLRNDKEFNFIIKDSDISRAVSQAFNRLHREIGFTYDLPYTFKIAYDEMED